ncbi:MAG: hypothetical protein WC307_02880 [Candidatus Nanoarchaeia archaeon]|jgi:hypothetical protein
MSGMGMSINKEGRGGAGSPRDVLGEVREKSVNIDVFQGECYLKHNGGQILLSKPGNFVVKDGDSIITGRNGYILGVSSTESLSEERSISIYPNSEVRFNIKKANGKDVIESFELIKGLFTVGVLTKKEITSVIKINPNYPKINFKPSIGKVRKSNSINMSIELMPNGSLVIFNIFGYNVVHERTGLIAKTFETLGMVLKPKITVTQAGIYVTDMSKHPDSRVDEINKRILDIGRTGSIDMMKKSYTDMTSKETYDKREEERLAQIQQELINENCKEKPDPKVVDFLKRQLGVAPTIIVSNETKDSFNIGMSSLKLSTSLDSPLPAYSAVSESDKVMPPKAVKRTAKSYDEIISEITDEQESIEEEIRKLMLPAGAIEMYKRMQAEGKSIPPKVADIISRLRSSRRKLEEGVKNLASDKGIVAQTASKNIDESIIYGKISLKFTKLEKGPEINMARAPAGKEYLFIYLDSVNKGKSDEFISPDEEFRLICNNEVIPLRNYRMETSKDPNKLYSNEQLFFVIPEDAEEFVLEIGKKTAAKQNVKLKI